MRGSLKTKLIVLFVLFACLPLLISAVLNGVAMIKTTEEGNLQANMQLNQQIAAGVRRSMDTNMGLNEALTVVPVIRSMNPENIQQAIIDIQKKNSQFELIAVLDANGQQIVRTSGKIANRSDRDYFKQAMKGKSVSSSAYISGSTNALCVTMASPVKDNSGKVIGVVASDISMKSLWDITDSIKIGATGYMDIVDETGTVIAHPNKEKIQNKESFAEKEYIAKVIRGESGKTTATSTQGQESLITYVPVDGYGWGVITYAPLKDLYGGVVHNALLLLAVLLIAMLLSVIVAFRITKGIISPLQVLMKAAQQISKGDLRQEIKVHGAAEINELSMQFNKMVVSLKALIIKTAETTETVSASSEELSASIDSVGHLTDNVMVTVNEVATNTKEKLIVSEQSMAVIGEMINHIEATVKSAGEIAKSADDSKQVADQGSKQSDEAIQKITSIQRDVNNTARVISLLGDKSQKIGRIVDTISGIAGQTNLLSLNAAIEAARAGEHGRGFAVVADEVSKLAAQSETAASEIADIVNEVKQETIAAVTTMEKSRLEVEQGVVSVQKTVVAFKDIYASIESLNKQIEEILLLATRQKDGSAKVEQAVQALSDFLQTNGRGIENIASMSNSQSISMKEIKQAAGALAQMAVELREEINKFSIK